MISTWGGFTISTRPGLDPPLPPLCEDFNTFYPLGEGLHGGGLKTVLGYFGISRGLDLHLLVRTWGIKRSGERRKRFQEEITWADGACFSSVSVSLWCVLSVCSSFHTLQLMSVCRVKGHPLLSLQLCTRSAASSALYSAGTRSFVLFGCCFSLCFLSPAERDARSVTS